MGNCSIQSPRRTRISDSRRAPGPVFFELTGNGATARTLHGFRQNERSPDGDDELRNITEMQPVLSAGTRSRSVPRQFNQTGTWQPLAVGSSGVTVWTERTDSFSPSLRTYDHDPGCICFGTTHELIRARNPAKGPPGHCSSGRSLRLVRTRQGSVRKFSRGTNETVPHRFQNDITEMNRDRNDCHSRRVTLLPIGGG